VTETLEGARRGRGHFDGVTTVVMKLFNIVAPDVAYFGQKDAQQAAAIKQFVRDLDMPVRIEVCPTVREADGLALSSRNVLLSESERTSAAALPRALEAAAAAVASGERALAEMTSAGVEPEYFELVSADTFAPVLTIEGDVLAVLAARLGNTRLIDNKLLGPNGRH
jgi:pantoate--beta-alanine ligase